MQICAVRMNLFGQSSPPLFLGLIRIGPPCSLRLGSQSFSPLHVCENPAVHFISHRNFCFKCMAGVLLLPLLKHACGLGGSGCHSYL